MAYACQRNESHLLREKRDLSSRKERKRLVKREREIELLSFGRRKRENGKGEKERKSRSIGDKEKIEKREWERVK